MTATLLLSIYSTDIHVDEKKNHPNVCKHKKVKEAVGESHKRITFNRQNNKLTCSHMDASHKHQVE